MVLIVLLSSMQNLGFFSQTSLTKSATNLAIFAGDLFPPNFAVIQDVWPALVETVQIAFVGTIFGFLLALPLGILGSRNLYGRFVTSTVRLFLSVVRAIPALLWALIFVVAVGLGPVAGTLGLAVYTLGYLGKLYYEAVEAVDPEVLEAVQATGCSKLQLVRFAVLPEAANHILSQLFFMFEYNVRSSSILGFVGAGGVGFYMLNYIQTLRYQSLMSVIILTLAVVLAIDFASGRIRSRFLTTQRLVRH